MCELATLLNWVCTVGLIIKELFLRLRVLLHAAGVNVSYCFPESLLLKKKHVILLAELSTAFATC